jgi:hypothetical protein
VNRGFPGFGNLTGQWLDEVAGVDGNGFLPQRSMIF